MKIKFKFGKIYTWENHMFAINFNQITTISRILDFQRNSLWAHFKTRCVRNSPNHMRILFCAKCVIFGTFRTHAISKAEYYQVQVVFRRHTNIQMDRIHIKLIWFWRFDFNREKNHCHLTKEST